jgi:phenylpropionate dioxygenase-like ring-hydroxylating dioxygenase large terminal subunit
VPVQFDHPLPETQRHPAYASPYIRDERDPSRFLVNREVFVRQEILDLERERIFRQCWLYVGHTSEIPDRGSFVTRSVGGQPVILTRDEHGDVRVWLNSCTHRGAEVCRERRGVTRRFRCFYHSWSFGTDGRLVAMPDEDAFPAGFDKRDYGLRRPAHVEEYRGFIFLNFSEDAPSLHDYLAGARQYLDITADQSAHGMQVLHGTHEYSLNANWKLLAENSYDGYHALPVHKTYFDVQRSRGDEMISDVRAEWRESGAFELGNGHTITVKRAPWGRPVARWKPSMGQESKPVVEQAAAHLAERHGDDYGEQIANLDFNMVIFPNLVVNNIMAVVIRKFEPIRPDLMHVTAWSLAPGEESPIARKIRNDSFLSFLGPAGLATPDDNEALESCQRGYGQLAGGAWSDVSRGMDKEVPMNYDEMQMRSYWRHWDALMTQRVTVAAPSCAG